MAGSGNNLRSEQVTAYYSTTAPSASTYTALNTFASASAQLGEVMDLTPPSQVRGTYTRSPMGSDLDTPVPGRLELGELTFSVYLDNSNTSHAAILDDTKSVDRHWAIRMNTGTTSQTIMYFTGFITDAHITTPNDGLVMLEVTVAVTNELVTVDQS